MLPVWRLGPHWAQLPQQRRNQRRRRRQKEGTKEEMEEVKVTAEEAKEDINQEDIKRLPRRLDPGRPG